MIETPDKIIQLDEYLGDEMTVQPLLLWANGKPCREMSKHASDASAYIKNITPMPGKSIVLVLAMGAYETYGENRNGDGFPEHEFAPGHAPTCGCCTKNGDVWVSRSETLPQHIHTFKQAKNYRHHVNKDPAKAVGDVLKEFWNPVMHRVELLVCLDDQKAPDLATKIADGEFPPVSMGCRIRYDVCNICGHRAPTRKHYCDHAKYQMRKILPDGRRVCVLNPNPRFFDISWVVRPADRTGYMLKKVAEHAYEIKSSRELGDYVKHMEEKRAQIAKLSTMDKIVRGYPVDSRNALGDESVDLQRYVNEYLPLLSQNPAPELGDSEVASLAQHGVGDVLSTLGAAGVPLSMSETTRLVGQQTMPDVDIPPEVLDRIVALQGPLLEYLEENPQVLDQLEEEVGLHGVSSQNVRPEIAEKVGNAWMEKRSGIMDYLKRRFVPPAMRETEPAYTDTLHVRDPATGTTYQTTRGDAIKAHDEIAKRQIYKMLGTGALLGIGAKLLSRRMPMLGSAMGASGPLERHLNTASRWAPYGVAAGIGAKTMKPDYGPQYITEEGVSVPTLTAFQYKHSSVLVPLGSAGLTTALHHDYESRMRRGELPTGGNIGENLYNMVAENAYAHPILTFIGGMGAASLAKKAIPKLANYPIKLADWIGDVALEHGDTVHFPRVDLDEVTYKIGKLVCL